MKLLILIILLSFSFFHPVLASDYVYPLEKFEQRQSYKHFGQFIDQNFYKNAPDVFPTKYYGFHAGTDLEIFPEEVNKNIPVYSITSGTITYAGYVDGYGGLILEKLDNQELTVLYGHLKQSSFTKSTGDRVTEGERLAYLGNEYSGETAGERKHLHFAIYNGTGNYFKGYEQSISALQAKWLDPIVFLQNNKAMEINQINPIPSPSPSIIVPIQKPVVPSATFFSLLITFLKNILNLFH
jgi:murein DD-endopeptidase MepM/ murein hydrolase activator NlpD